MTSPNTPGVFIVFEGGDGVGKSTQAVILVDDLRRRGYDVVATREPGSGDLGAAIRSIVLDADSAISDRTETLLFAADRAQHVADVIRPALARGAIVVCDRYIDSSIAYQSAGRGLRRDDIEAISSWASDGLVPDVTVVLEADERTARERRVARTGLVDRIESAMVARHAEIASAFRLQAERHPQRYRVIDASPDDVAAVAYDVHDAVLPFLDPKG